MSRILSAGLAATMLLSVVEPAVGQTEPAAAQVSVVQSQRMESPPGPGPNPDTFPAVATTTPNPFYETRWEGNPIVKDRDLFTMEFQTGVVFRATCQHIELFDPCLQLPLLLSDLGVASALADRTRTLMEEMLDRREIIERLEQLTIEKIRGQVREQGGPQQGFDFTGLPALGSVAFSSGMLIYSRGNFLRASSEEEEAGRRERRIGATIAVVGLGLVLKPLFDRWWGSSNVRASGGHVAVTW